MGYSQITRTLVNKTITNGSLTIDFTKSSGVTFAINAPNHGLVGTSTITINSATNANDGYQAIFDRNIIGKTFECSTLDVNTLILNQRVDNFFNPVAQQLFTITTATLSFNVANNDFLYAVKNNLLSLTTNFQGNIGKIDIYEAIYNNITNTTDYIGLAQSWTTQVPVNIISSGSGFEIGNATNKVYKFTSNVANLPIVLMIKDIC